MKNVLALVLLLSASSSAFAGDLTITCGGGRDFLLNAQMDGGNSVPTITHLVNDDVDWSKKSEVIKSKINSQGSLEMTLGFGGPLTYGLPNVPYNAEILASNCDQGFRAVAKVSVKGPGVSLYQLKNCTCSFR